MEREDEWVGSFLFQFVRPADPFIPRIRSGRQNVQTLAIEWSRRENEIDIDQAPFFLSKDVAHASQCSIDKSQRNINRVSMLLFLSTFSILSGPFDVFALRPSFVAMRDSPYEEITRMNHVYTDPEREEKGWKVNTEQRSRRTFWKKRPQINSYNSPFFNFDLSRKFGHFAWQIYAYVPIFAFR